MQKIIAVIPARGGSKGIPKKNLCIINGKPLLVHTIEHAIKTKAISGVYVSTDDQEIAEIALLSGAQVTWRPAEISTDIATSESALINVLDHYVSIEKNDPDIVVFLQATSPIRHLDDIANAIELFNIHNADSLFSASLVHGFIWRTDSIFPVPINYDPLIRQRRQEINEKILEENGSIYIFKPWVLRKFHSRLGGKIIYYSMPRISSIQIDEPEDIELVESLFAIQNSK